MQGLAPPPHVFSQKWIPSLLPRLPQRSAAFCLELPICYSPLSSPSFRTLRGGDVYFSPPERPPPKRSRFRLRTVEGLPDVSSFFPSQHC